MQHPRLQGDEFHEMVAEFMAAMNHHFPKCLVQFEDFSTVLTTEYSVQVQHVVH